MLIVNFPKKKVAILFFSFIIDIFFYNIIRYSFFNINTLILNINNIYICYCLFNFLNFDIMLIKIYFIFAFISKILIINLYNLDYYKLNIKDLNFCDFYSIIIIKKKYQKYLNIF